MGGGASIFGRQPLPQSGRSAHGYYCHGCQVSIERLSSDGTCPRCHQGFVEESSVPVLTSPGCSDPHEVARLLEESVEAVRWLTAEEGAPDCMETRIAQLLEDLHHHLSLAEDADTRQARQAAAEESAKKAKFDAAPAEVLASMRSVVVDGQ